MSSIEALQEKYGPSYKLIAIATSMVCVVSAMLSATIINIAIPDIMGAFGISQVKAQWLSTAFIAAMTSTMLLTDWIVSSVGTRGAMQWALGVFTIGSIIGGIATGENVLIFARILQGAGAGVVQPVAMLIIYHSFPPEERGKGMGIFGFGVVLAPAIGPWVGGLLMESFDWRIVFLMSIPFAGLGMLFASIFLPTRADKGKRRSFDYIGFILLVLALSLALTALSSGQRLGWSSWPMLRYYAISIIASVIFLWWENRIEKPIVELGIFKVAPYSAVSVVGFVLGGGIFGSTYLLPLFVQSVQGMTPVDAGLLLMPAGVALVIMFPLAGWLCDKISATILIVVGLLLFAIASFLSTNIDLNTGFWTLALWTLLGRIGLGLIFPAIAIAGLRALPDEQVAQGSGMANFTRQLGGGFGVAFLSVMLEQRTAHHVDALTATQTMDNSSSLAYILEYSAAMQGQFSSTEQLAGAMSSLGRTLYIQAYTSGFQDGFMIAGLLFLSALIPTFIYEATRPGSSFWKRRLQIAVPKPGRAEV